MGKYIEVYFFFLIITVLQSLSCTGTNYKKLSIENPAALIAIEDSLLLLNKINPQGTFYGYMSKSSFLD